MVILEIWGHFCHFEGFDNILVIVEILRIYIFFYHFGRFYYICVILERERDREREGFVILRLKMLKLLRLSKRKHFIPQR